MIQRLRRDQRGGVSVIVALSLVVLLGAAALAIDTGALYAERAELQSGADAAALAIAHDCALGTCGDATATAQLFANQNAKDNAANVDTPTFPTANSVRVRTTTRDASGAGSLTLSLAPFLGIDRETVSATSGATWGSPARGPAALPLTFAPCVFDLSGRIQVIQTHGSGAPSCTSTSPSGQTLPGGFGWLAHPNGTCEITVGTSSPVAMSGDSGNNLPAECEAVLRANINQEIVLPIYQDKNGSGSSGTYRLDGWAAFRLLGWNFPGSNYANNTYAGARCNGSCNGLIGQFVRHATLDDRFTAGGTNYGTFVVKLTE